MSTTSVRTYCHLIRIACSRGTEVAYHAKIHFLHPRGIQLDFSILIVLKVLDMKPLFNNATRIALRGKCIFVCHIGQVKQTFLA